MDQIRASALRQNGERFTTGIAIALLSKMELKKALISTVLLLLCPNLAGALPNPVVCESALATVTESATGSPSIAAGSIAYPATPTGEARYSTPLVLVGLGLNAWLNAPQQTQETITAQMGHFELRPLFKAKTQPPQATPWNILSLGEGYSGLTPYLRSLGHTAYGLDLWYDLDLTQTVRMIGGLFMMAYVRTHRPYLITGDATNLRQVHSSVFNSIPDNHFDLVVSHHMFYFLTPEAQISAAKEAFRVLKPGGFVVFSTHRGVKPELIKAMREGRIPFLIEQVSVKASAGQQPSSLNPILFESLFGMSVRPPALHQTQEYDIERILIYKP